jgi:hypothetical protein
MATPTRERIFPLHLTPIEKFLLADDRPHCPMAFVIDLTFAGVLDRAAFDAALAEAVQRHPLLVSLVRPAKRKTLCWVSSNGQMPFVDWAKEGVPITLPNGEWINLHDEVGLRIWIRQGVDRVQMTTQFHHACCDGIGAYRFLGDLLAIYGARTSAEGPRPTMETVTVSRLRGRTDGCRYLYGTGQRSRQIRTSIAQMCRIVGQGCTPLRPSKPKGKTTIYPGYCSYTFDTAEFKRLRDAANELGAMINDLLAVELFYVMEQWNASRRWSRFGQRYRIMMPVDLRDTRDYETPACNIIGYSFLGCKPSQLRNIRRLAARIREETALIKHERLGERFVDMISVGSEVRGLLPFFCSVPRTLATVVLSNIGDPSRRFLAKFRRKAGCVVAGNLVLERISGYPPVRPKTHGAFSIVSYRRELTLGLRLAPHRFSMNDTQEMLTMYVERLRQHLGAE